MLKSIGLLALVVVLMSQNAFAAQKNNLSSFQQEFAAVCLSQMRQQSSSSGLKIPDSLMQSYCQCTSADLVRSAQSNPVLMKMLSEPETTPAAALDGYLKTSANKCTAKYFTP